MVNIAGMAAPVAAADMGISGPQPDLAIAAGKAGPGQKRHAIFYEKREDGNRWEKSNRINRTSSSG